MKPPPSSENDNRDQEVIKLLESLGSFKSKYPPELLAARRAAFVAQIEQLKSAKVEAELNSGDEEIVKLLGSLKSASTEYPQDLLAARRAAFLQQIENVTPISPLDWIRLSLQGLFQPKPRIPAMPGANLQRTSLALALLLIVALIGSLLFSRTEQSIVQPTPVLPTGTHPTGPVLCKPGDQAPSCSSGGLGSSQDLAAQGNGIAQPAVSKDARASDGVVYQAAYANDGRGDTSWVSNSAHSWIKIDLGNVRTINTVTLQKGWVGSSQDNDLGQFVIAVSQSDLYSDGNSSNDYTEYAQVFNSEQTGFNGTLPQGETVKTQFSPVKARFVKLTFERAGAAIEEVGVFMIQPSEQAGSPTKTTSENKPEDSATLVSANPLLPIATSTATPALTDSLLLTQTLTGLPTDTPLSPETELPTDTVQASETPVPLPTDTLPLADTATDVPLGSSPFDTPNPLPTIVPPITIPSTVQSLPVSTEPILITGHDQDLTFICTGNDVEIRGHANTVTLLGSCNSITITGNRNQIFWQSGAPVITNNGKDNLISQM